MNPAISWSSEVLLLTCEVGLTNLSRSGLLASSLLLWQLGCGRNIQRMELNSPGILEPGGMAIDHAG